MIERLLNFKLLKRVPTPIVNQVHELSDVIGIKNRYEKTSVDKSFAKGVVRKTNLTSKGYSFNKIKEMSK